MHVTRRRVLGLGVALLCALAIIWLAGTMARLEVACPSGPHAVGRTRLAWIDSQRPERHDHERRREVIAEVWYPAKPRSGSWGRYMPELAAVSPAVVASGGLSRFEAWGLGQVRCREQTNAAFADVSGRCPVVVFSPGNSTNVELYAAYGEELASHGYVVFGVNHPYDVQGVRLHDGLVATYVESGHGEPSAIRVDERAADIRFLIDRLSELDSGDGLFAGRLDLNHIGVMGHSRGGHTAARAAATDIRIVACINVDGLHAGNPYLVRDDGPVPAQPFLYIGKQRTIGPRTEQFIGDNPQGSLVSVPDAAHLDFSDGPSFEPALNPFDEQSRSVLTTACRAAREFFDKHLR